MTRQLWCNVGMKANIKRQPRAFKSLNEYTLRGNRVFCVVLDRQSLRQGLVESLNAEGLEIDCEPFEAISIDAPDLLILPERTPIGIAVKHVAPKNAAGTGEGNRALEEDSTEGGDDADWEDAEACQAEAEGD